MIVKLVEIVTLVRKCKGCVKEGKQEKEGGSERGHCRVFLEG